MKKNEEEKLLRIAETQVKPFSLYYAHLLLHVIFIIIAGLEYCHRPKKLLKWKPLAVIQLIFRVKKKKKKAMVIEQHSEESIKVGTSKWPHQSGVISS